MARYKPTNYAQGRFISIAFEHQILPRTFEHALNYIVDNKLNFAVLDDSRKNDDSGAPAYDPRVMLKIILYAYSRGILSSREIEAACNQNVVMMALSADTRPHFTTIAQFVGDLEGAIKGLFVDVLMYCDELNLIGREMFAIDGCKMSSNASKEWSGTRADFEKKKTKFRARVDQLVKKHRAMDKESEPEELSGMRASEEKAIKSLEARAAKIEAWLSEHPEDRRGSQGQALKSSMTDIDSAKMTSSRGVIQGYNGVAVADAKHQIIVGAKAIGNASEAKALGPMMDLVKENFRKLGDEDISKEAKLSADSGFHSEDSMKGLADRGIDGYVVDKGFRKRDSAFETAQRHRSRKALIGRSQHKRKYFDASEFTLNPANGKLVCPAGKELYVKDRNFKTHNGYFGIQYMAKKTDCRVCELRTKCLRNLNSPARTVSKLNRREKATGVFSQKMIDKIESAAGRYLYGMRMGIIEPVFANLRCMLGLDRFTLRGAGKVSTQWQLFALVHNLGKIHRFAWNGAG